MRRDFVKLSERASRIDFGGLGDHGTSSDASGLGREKAQQGSLAAGSSVADAVESYLMLYRLDRTSREDRQRALDAVLSARPDWAELVTEGRRKADELVGGDRGESPV